jgi:hypothetical protein
MEWERWPLYVQRRYALAKAHLRNPGSVCCEPLGEHESVEAREVVDWIYGVLSILDAKASTLMRLDGVLIAAAAFLLGLFGRPESILSTTRPDAILVILAACLSALSLFLCLFVANISWGFLVRVTKNRGNRTFEFAREIQSLDRAMRFRQTVYQLAWLVSLIASIGFFLEFLMQARHVVGFFFSSATQ